MFSKMIWCFFNGLTTQHVRLKSKIFPFSAEIFSFSTDFFFFNGNSAVAKQVTNWFNKLNFCLFWLASWLE